MNILYLIIFFIFGTLMGSFLTVIGLRLPKKENFTTTHSHCDSCGHILTLTEMIPIISYILQKGRCRHCGKKVDILSTYVELFTGALFAVAFYAFGFSYELLIALGIVSLLMIVVVSDITYLIIPDEALVFFSIYFIIFQILNLGLIGAGKQILSGIFLFGVMYLIMIIGNKTLKKESLGGGDIKMMFVFGLILDPLLGTLAIFLGSLIALPTSLVLLKKQKERVIPFGPFLLLALTFIYFAQISTPMVLRFLSIS
jgi:leader peptidase (prepilin peptidase)/N-methyltransferase